MNHLLSDIIILSVGISAGVLFSYFIWIKSGNVKNRGIALRATITDMIGSRLIRIAMRLEVLSIGTNSTVSKNLLKLSEDCRQLLDEISSVDVSE